jgi:proline dehydrogenase
VSVALPPLIVAIFAAEDSRDADQVSRLTQDFNATLRRLYDRAQRHRFDQLLATTANEAPAGRPQ